jgi:16S rRNA (guanine1207-N2)-methyltransferase
MIDRDVLKTLDLALSPQGALGAFAKRPVLVLRAPAELSELLPPEHVAARTTFKPDHDALIRRGYTLLALDAPLPSSPLTIVFAPRQRDEMRAVFARAMEAAPEGGVVLCCLANTQGARTAEEHLESLAGETQSLSKHKCRAFWAVKRGASFNSATARKWIEADQPQWIEDGAFWSRPGLFSWDRIDPGTDLLADSIPESIEGLGADFGAGAGLIACEVLEHCPKVSAMHLYEAEHRALAVMQANLADSRTHEIHWADVTQDVPSARYDFVVMNPPFHLGRADANSIGQAFILAAARALKPSGALWMVANRHLPYEATLTAAFKGHQLIEDTGGYKIIRAERPKRK